MKRRTLERGAILALLLFFAFWPFAFAGLTCEDAYRQLLEKTGVVVDHGFVDLRDITLVSEPTVSVIGTEEGKHGGKLLVLNKKNGKPWHSGYTTVNYDLQGDPRWLINTLGKSAETFGFRVVDESTMTIPDHAELLQGILKVNKVLESKGQEPIVASFFDTNHSGNVNVYKYMNMWKTEGKVPLGDSGNHYIHDISFHTGAMYLPKKIVSYSQRQFEFKDNLFTFIESELKPKPNVPMAPPKRTLFQKLRGVKEAPKTAEEATAAAEKRLKLAEAYRHWYNFQDTVDVDNGTGLITVGMLNSIRNIEKGVSYIDSYFYSALNRLVGGKRSPREAMQEMQENLQEYRREILEQYEKMGTALSREEKIKIIAEKPPISLGEAPELPRVMSKAKVRMIIEDFLDPQGMHQQFDSYVAAYLKTVPDGFDPKLPAYKAMGFKDHDSMLQAMCEELTRKRAHIIQALDEIKAGKAP